MKRIAPILFIALSFTSCGSSDSVAATATKGDAFCKLAQVARDDNDALSAADFTDKAKLKLLLTSAIDSLSAMSAKAPKDVAATIKKELDEELSVEKLLKANDYDFVKMASTPEGKKLLESSSSTSSGEIDTYLDEKCGIAPPDTTPTDTTPADSVPTDSGQSINLPEGDEGLQQFIDLLSIGLPTPLTDVQKQCLFDGLSGKVTSDDLEGVADQTVSGEAQTTIGLALVSCGVTDG
jgi:hypothetical protein